MNEVIYRPQNKPEKELKDDFVIRLAEFQKINNSLKNDLKNGSPQHLILQGMRGTGKTTLMYRTFYEINDQYRSKGYVPVIFSEEQYGVRTLYKFWEQIALYLENNEEAYAGLWHEMQEAQDFDDYEDRCFEILKKYVEREKHRLILLIDNFGIMIDKFQKQEQQRLREILITFSGLKIIGGSSVLLESFFRYDKSFFDFFKVIQLTRLDHKAVITLLTRLGVKKGTDKIETIIKTQAGRIDALRILTGGVPRTIVLLFEILLDNQNGNSIEDLKKLLDDVTPLYKHRMDELPAQQQEIVDKLALNWDGMSTSEIAKKTRMDSKAVSAQLNSLVKSNVVHAEKSTGKNKFYQLEERFFNIWYLMQHAPRNSQQKVIWLTKFLETWCDKNMLNEHVNTFLIKLKSETLNSDYINILTSALIQTEGIDWTMREDLINESNLFLMNEPLISPLPFNEFSDKFNSHIENKDLKKAKNILDKALLPSSQKLFYLGIIEIFTGNFDAAELTLNESLLKGNNSAAHLLGKIFKEEKNNTVQAKKFFERDIDNSSSNLELAEIYDEENDLENAEKYYLLAIKNGSKKALKDLGMFYEDKLNDFEKAEDYYMKARESGDQTAIHNLAQLLTFILNKGEVGKKYLVEEINNGNKYAEFSLMILAFYFNWSEFKSKISEIIDNNKENTDEQQILASIISLLWLDRTEDSLKKLDDVLGILNISENQPSLGEVLRFLIVKKLYHYTYSLFEREDLKLKDHFKVHYYALMKIMEDEYPNEIKRMGRELEEPVNQMVEHIKAETIRYDE